MGIIQLVSKARSSSLLSESYQNAINVLRKYDNDGKLSPKEEEQPNREKE